jgi:tryptophan synthase alpha subunit
MNAIEQKFFDYEAKKQGAIIVEIPLLSPVPQTQLDVAQVLVKAGIDVIQVPIPVRFPWMYGARIQTIQKMAAHNDTCFKHSFEVLSMLIEKYRETAFMPVGFYGGLQRMGQSNYVEKCAELGVKMVDVPDYPVVHDNDPRGLVKALNSKGISYITVISTDMAMEPEGSRGYMQLERLVAASGGFCFLLAVAGGKTGEKKGFDYDLLARAKTRIIEVQNKVNRRCPVVAVCGISEPEQVRILVKDIGLHVMFGSALFTRMMRGDSNEEIYRFLMEMKDAAS